MTGKSAQRIIRKAVTFFMADHLLIYVSQQKTNIACFDMPFQKLPEIIVPYPLCSMPYALCPMLYALCPIPYALCPMLYALCPMLYALCSLLYALYFCISNGPVV